MDASFRVTLVELRKALAWAEAHALVVHGGNLPYADIVFRRVGRSHDEIIVMCEQCDRVPGKAGDKANYEYVTDYDAW